MSTRSTEMMIRFLLPCTAQADQGAIDAAIEVAHSCGATLVPLSLQQGLKTEEEGAVQAKSRLSQHSFLEMVQHQAAIMEVPLEWFELSTHDAGRSIHVFAEEMNCSGILLFVREGKGILLETKDVRYVIEHEHIILPFLIRLIPKETTPFLPLWKSHQFQSKKNVTILQKKKAFPRWYPFALLTAGLLVAILGSLNGMYLLQEPVFTLASLIAKLIFVCVFALSLAAILKFFVERWRQRQEQLEKRHVRR